MNFYKKRAVKSIEYTQGPNEVAKQPDGFKNTTACQLMFQLILPDHYECGPIKGGYISFNFNCAFRNTSHVVWRRHMPNHPGAIFCCAGFSFEAAITPQNNF